MSRSGNLLLEEDAVRTALTALTMSSNKISLLREEVISVVIILSKNFVQQTIFFHMTCNFPVAKSVLQDQLVKRKKVFFQRYYFVEIVCYFSF